MKKRQAYQLLLFVLLFSFVTEIWIGRLLSISRMERLHENTVMKMEFRDQQLGEKMINSFCDGLSRGMQAGIYLLESKFGYQPFPYTCTEKTFCERKKTWEQKKAWNTYLKINQAIWDDVKYFPVPESTTDEDATVVFENGWMKERNYGGKRGHEGCDLMAKKMSQDIIRSSAWRTVSYKVKGGFRKGDTVSVFWRLPVDTFITHIWIPMRILKRETE